MICFRLDHSILQVERGTAVKGAEIEILGLGTSLKTTLTGIGAELITRLTS